MSKKTTVKTDGVGEGVAMADGGTSDVAPLNAVSSDAVSPDQAVPNQLAPDTETQAPATAVVMTDTKAGPLLFDRVLLMDALQARAAFDSLSGEIHPSVASALIDDSRYARKAVVSRLRMTLGAASAVPKRDASYPTAVAKLGHGTSAAGSAAATWGQVYGAWGNLSSSEGTVRLNRSTRGFILGADTEIGAVWRAGLLDGVGSNSLRMEARSSSASVESYTLGAYGGSQYGATALRFGAAHTWHDIDAKRSLPLFGERADSAYHARTAQVFGEAGYQFDLLGAAFEPFAQLAYVHLHTRGFEEGGTLGFKARSADHDTTFSTLGVRAETVVGRAEKSALTGQVMMGWQHAWGALTLTSTFSLLGGSPFNIQGVPLARDALVLGTGLNFVAGKTLNIHISYAGQLAQNSTSQTVSGNLIWQF